MGGDPEPSPKCPRLLCRQWTRAGRTSPAMSTSGLPWSGPAASFSCHWSSQASATAVSPGESRGKTARFLQRFALGSPCGQFSWVRISGTLSCTAGPGTAYVFRGESTRGKPLLFPHPGKFLGGQSPIPGAAAAGVGVPPAKPAGLGCGSAESQPLERQARPQDCCQHTSTPAAERWQRDLWPGRTDHGEPETTPPAVQCGHSCSLPLPQGFQRKQTIEGEQRKGTSN